MSEALQQLSGMPEVIGCMLFDQAGQVLDSAFPSLFDAQALGQVAAGLAGDGYFSEWTTGEHGAYDLHFTEGWVLVRRVSGSWLLVLCTPQANAQLLQMSLTQVSRRLRAAPAVAAPPPRAPLGQRLRTLVQAELGDHAAQAQELIAAAGDDPRLLAAAVADVVRLTRLFIDTKKADALGRTLRDELEK